MKVSVRKLAEKEPINKTDRAAFRKAAYSFMLSEIISIDNDIKLHIDKYRYVDEEILPFAKDGLGKPYLPGHPEIHCSLSHSRNGYAAVAAALDSEAAAVGVDIERRFLYNEALARRICSEAEADRLREAKTEEEKQSLLNLFWSRKEAILKCEGTGIRSSLRKVDTEHIDEERYEMFGRQTKEYTLAACMRRAD